MGNSTGRRRDFPTGTPTIQREITFSVEEWHRIERMADEKDIAPSKLLAEGVLAGDGNVTETTATDIKLELIKISELLSANWLEVTDIRRVLQMIMEAGAVDGLDAELLAQMKEQVGKLDTAREHIRVTTDRADHALAVRL